MIEKILEGSSYISRFKTADDQQCFFAAEKLDWKPGFLTLSLSFAVGSRRKMNDLAAATRRGMETSKSRKPFLPRSTGKGSIMPLLALRREIKALQEESLIWGLPILILVVGTDDRRHEAYKKLLKRQGFIEYSHGENKYLSWETPP